MVIKYLISRYKACVIACLALMFLLGIGRFGCVLPGPHSHTRLPEEMYKDALVELASAKSRYSRWCVLGDASRASYIHGKIGEAESYAQEMMNMCAEFPGDWNVGNALHLYHIIKGKLALDVGDIDLAVVHLLAAADVPSSPQLETFGPDMSLASDLLSVGQQAQVLAYFKKCAASWKNRDLNEWIRVLEAGGTPNFGPKAHF